MAPLNTVGIALQKAATKVMRTASVAERPERKNQCHIYLGGRCTGAPKVTIAEPVLHVDMVTRSETQYVKKAPLPQVLLSMGTGSMSAFVQTSGGAMLLGCFGSAQLEG